MTDKFHYQDVFQTINIPKNERPLLHRSLSFFDNVYGDGPWNPYLTRSIDTASASQLFWERDETGSRFYDRMAISALHNNLTIAIEHRDFDAPEFSSRKTIQIGNGSAHVFESDLIGRGFNNQGLDTREARLAFKADFFTSASRLALYRGLGVQNPADQNESMHDIFANAA